MSRIAAVSYEHVDKFGFARGKSLASVCFQELYGRLTALMSGRTLWRQDGKPRASDTRSHGHGGAGNRRRAHGCAGFRQFRLQIVFPVAVPRREYIINRLDVLGITCIHVVEGATGRPRDVAPFEYGSLRRRFSRTYIANNRYDLDLVTPHRAHGKADLIAFGRPFVANPNLVERLQSDPG